MLAGGLGNVHVDSEVHAQIQDLTWCQGCHAWWAWDADWAPSFPFMLLFSSLASQLSTHAHDTCIHMHTHHDAHAGHTLNLLSSDTSTNYIIGAFWSTFFVNGSLSHLFFTDTWLCRLYLLMHCPCFFLPVLISNSSWQVVVTLS